MDYIELEQVMTTIGKGQSGIGRQLGQVLVLTHTPYYKNHVVSCPKRGVCVCLGGGERIMWFHVQN